MAIKCVPKVFDFITQKIGQSPILIEGTSLACEKCEEKCMNYFSLVWVTFKHVKDIPGYLGYKA